MKKQDFYAVYTPGDVNARAIFLLEKDALLYGYIRFGDKSVTTKVQMVSKHTFGSLPFKEGVAFNKVMKMRYEIARKKR